MGSAPLEIMRDNCYEPHMPPQGEEKIAVQNSFKARRWIVAVVHPWFNRFWKMLVRYEKTNRALEYLLQQAATMIIFQRTRNYSGIYFLTRIWAQEFYKSSKRSDNGENAFPLYLLTFQNSLDANLYDAIPL